TITTIDANAFKGCSSLKSTELETNTGITKLGGNAFQGCTSLISTGLEKNTTITSVDPGIFAGCSSLTSTGLETNKAINYISTSMFEKCTSLTSTGLETNTSVTRLGWKVFLGCSSLTSTGLGTNKDITYLEDNTFAFCASLTSTGLETNKGIKGLGNYAFKGCNSITNTGLETNTTITRLMNSVFEGCSSLTNTGLGTNTTITKIGGRAFFGDTKIKNIVFLIDQLPAMKSDTFSNTNVEIYYLPEVTIKPTIASTGAKAVHELSVQNIILKNKASKLNYIEGQEFEPSGLELTVNYDMGHKRVIKYDDTTKANFSFDKTVLSLKDTEITVTYCGKPATLPITVVKKKLIKTEVKRNIDKVDYIEEETFDPRGLELELTYDNGKSEVIKYDDTTKTKFTFDKTVLSLKDTEITVTYEGQNITLPITVVKKKLVKTEVKSNTAKDDYIEGETFDPKGLELELKYDNGKSEVIKYDNTTKTKFTFDKTELSLEDTEIIVTYGGKPATLPITVVKKKVVNAKVIRNIDKVDYIEGEALDPKGLEIEVKYNNGKSEVIKYNDATKANFTFDKMELSLKDTKITVTYGGKPATLPITVVKKKVVNAKVIRNIDKVDYIEGETLDPKGLEIEVKYNNGKSEVITYDDTTKAKFTFDKTELSLKDTEIIVTYGGHTVTLPISVTSETNK
ncbi:MAG: leucine-rich repeat protein, partial [Erysipelotrichaceae bacterium]